MAQCSLKSSTYLDTKRIISTQVGGNPSTAPLRSFTEYEQSRSCRSSSLIFLKPPWSSDRFRILESPAAAYFPQTQTVGAFCKKPYEVKPIQRQGRSKLAQKGLRPSSPTSRCWGCHDAGKSSVKSKHKIFQIKN